MVSGKGEGEGEAGGEHVGEAGCEGLGEVEVREWVGVQSEGEATYQRPPLHVYVHSYVYMHSYVPAATTACLYA
jgi:hypothetical protein